MKRVAILLGGLAASLALGGCISTAKTIVMAPVHAASFTADKLTTSQSESDRNLGRKVRKQRERDAKACRRQQRDAGERGQPAQACAVQAGY